MDFLIGHPFRIFFIAVLFVVGGLVSGRQVGNLRGRAAFPCYVAAGFWLIYAFWESFMWKTATIRVDLFLVYPVLLIVSILAIFLSVHRARNREV